MTIRERKNKRPLREGRRTATNRTHTYLWRRDHYKYRERELTELRSKTDPK
ncbi:MAG: hypothetical protein ABIG28_00875 [archaeon]